jgi:hypothetical protein
MAPMTTDLPIRIRPFPMNPLWLAVAPHAGID